MQQHPRAPRALDPAGAGKANTPNDADQIGRSTHARLVAQLAERAGGLDPAPMIEGGPFAYGGRIVNVLYVPHPHKPRLLVRMDLGSLAAPDPVRVYRKLLTENHASCMQGQAFSLSASGQVIYSDWVDLQGLDLDGLLMALERMGLRVDRLVDRHRSEFGKA